MNDRNQTEHRNDKPGEVSYEYEVGVGPARVITKSRVTGTSEFVDHAANLSSEYPSLVRWGIFTVIFVPIALVTISELPDIILAVNAVLN